MMRYVFGMVLATLLFVDVPSGWSQQQYLYTPAAVTSGGTTQSKDGILVQEVAVQKGDSLYKISRRFSGYGSYYPQILLFNDIKNPNKIYPGNVIKVPVARNRILRPVDKAPSYGGKKVHQKSFAAKPSTKKQRAARAADATAGQKLFEQAVKAYRQDDCRAALESFDRFLTKNQSSPLAPDASLYKADCYLRLSNQK